MIRPIDPDPQIVVIAASLEQKPVLANLLELYVHEFCDFMEIEIGPDGRFGYSGLDLYWKDPQRFPFLVYVGRSLAGFFLVQNTLKHGGTVWDMAEFFILRGFRRRSIGTIVARQAFEHFPGRWQVRVMQPNRPACAFWSRAVREYAGNTARLDHETASGKEWNVFSFSSPPEG